MQSDQLLSAIQQTLQKNKVIALAKIAADENHTARELIDLSFHSDQQIGFRAAWILENIYTINEQRFLPHLSYFLKRFGEQQNPSAQRHFAKILALVTKKTASQKVKKELSQLDMEGLIATVFDWLIDKKVPVAVKAHCVSILANLSSEYRWIKAELLQMMDFLIDTESIAFFAKVKQVKKQLAKI